MKIRTIIISLCLILLFFTAMNAQSISGQSDENSVKNIGKTIFSDFADIGTAPFKMSKKDALLFTAFAAVNAGLVFGTDEQIDKDFTLEGDDFYIRHTKHLLPPGQFYDRMGPQVFSTALIGMFATGGIFLRDKKMLQTSFLLTESYLITALLTRLGKISIGRARPYNDKGARFYKSFYSKADKERFYSMPSGHTSSAFAAMTVLAQQYPQKYIKYPAYALAASVALQRMDDRKHWLSDVIIGGALGHWVAKKLVNRNRSQVSASTFTPYLAKNKLGFVIHF
ncbi:MAG: PAP2 family protein [Calditrichaeota bacterium]|nr:MAG: PAP2 family protein [Calditrichota bacterium]